MACSDCIVHQVGSGEFLERLATVHPGPGELPLSGSIELTFRCNLRCRHCYIHCPGATDGEMTTDQVRLVLDQLADAGALMLLLTGGEVFLRRDFREIYLHAKQRGFLLTLFTNATLIDDDLADFLAACPPRRVEISIYGHTAETCEKITGVPGSFRRFRDGVRRLLDRRLPVYFKSLVMNSNAHEFPAIRAWAEGFGRPFRFDAIINPALDGGTAPLAERLPPAEVAALHLAAEGAREEIAGAAGKAREAAADDRLVKCGAGIQTFHVDARGILHPCMMWRATPYDLLAGSVEGWKRSLKELRNRRAPTGTPCPACEHRFACACCAATSLLETGTAGAPVDYYCRICAERESLSTENQDLELKTAAAR